MQKITMSFLQYIILGDLEAICFMPGFAIINELVLCLLVVPLHRECRSEDEEAEVCNIHGLVEGPRIKLLTPRQTSMWNVNRVYELPGGSMARSRSRSRSWFDELQLPTYPPYLTMAGLSSSFLHYSPAVLGMLKGGLLAEKVVALTSGKGSALGTQAPPKEATAVRWTVSYPT